ncbi:UvrD-helicase domain-containing protein [uncultured Winogradskyella sp.]|uniref:UvrD-helicase domain-containing protein n=1 Tax=uncultured Winogradskyella sp. TaxID=395353 RepID=UPI003514B65B
MQPSQFKIYNASAGSGKTYTLAKSYLKILIASNDPLEFKHVLAITFTNKAVGEMKDRIISMLRTFSSMQDEDDPHPMLKDISEELQLSFTEIKSKSKQILKHILHNYGAFDISTIDAFTHRLIRTFAHDLRLPLNFEVELDQERLLNEAVDKLISKAGVDQLLTKTLVNFAVDKTNDDKSWDISYDLNQISGILLKENDLGELEKIKDKTLEDFGKLKQILISEVTSEENALRNTAEKTLDLISNSGLEHSDFMRKSLPNYFLKLAEGSTNVSFGAVWQTNLLENEALYPSRVSEKTAEVINNIQPQLAEAFAQTKVKVFEIKFLKSALNNLTPFSVLNLISQELNMLKADKNVMLISEFNNIISQQIRNQPTPFIYERLGERFNHYFIDEFQDTSTLQWQNLVPLLDNTLSSGKGLSMIVGDAKQAIYRWRGSDPEQFISLYSGEDRPFYAETSVFNLETNYRSAEHIIDFNNSLFNYISHAFFEAEDHSSLYKASHQEKNLKRTGYVELRFLELEKDDIPDEEYPKEVLDMVENCIDLGYKYKDICVITRKRKEGVAVAQYLSANKIPITSSETLLLKNSPKVKFLNNILKLLVQPTNYKLRIEALQYLADREEVTNKHEYFLNHLSLGLEDFLAQISLKKEALNLKSLMQSPLYELVEQLVRIFELNDISDAYLEFYLDEVFEFVQKNQSDISAFLRYFEENEEKLSIVVSNDIDAVQIMTIHKSKGLEFPVVIFPYADLDIYRENRPKIWFPVDKEDYKGFESLLINFNKDVEHYREPGKYLYNQRRQQLALDNINLLYVVLTRAVEQLYVVSKKDMNAKGEFNSNTFSGILISYLQNKNLWSDTENQYVFGKQEHAYRDDSVVNSELLDFISVPKEEHNLNILTNASYFWDSQHQEAIERGNLIHLILSKIKTHTDLDFAFDELKNSGNLGEESERSLKPLIQAIIYHPELKDYFEGSFEVFNEKDILVNSGNIIRPDRIIVKPNKAIILMDYKTGNKQQQHSDQINNYAAILTDMGFQVQKKLLIYVNETIKITEV